MGLITKILYILKAPEGLRREQSVGQHSGAGRQVLAPTVFYDRDTYHHIWKENFQGKGGRGKKKKKIGIGLKQKRKKKYLKIA